MSKNLRASDTIFANIILILISLNTLHKVVLKTMPSLGRTHGGMVMEIFSALSSNRGLLLY